jgi:hypothetical protein
MILEKTMGVGDSNDCLMDGRVGYEPRWVNPGSVIHQAESWKNFS